MLRELRFLFSPKHTQLIDYLKKETVNLQKKNISVLLREGKQEKPVLYATFDGGHEKMISLDSIDLKKTIDSVVNK